MSRASQNHKCIGICSVYMVLLAGKSPYIQSYTVCIYDSGQSYLWAFTSLVREVSQNCICKILWAGRSADVNGHVRFDICPVGRGRMQIKHNAQWAHTRTHAHNTYDHHFTRCPLQPSNRFMNDINISVKDPFIGTALSPDQPGLSHRSESSTHGMKHLLHSIEIWSYVWASGLAYDRK